MFVCLCNGITSHAVADAVDAGACTTNEVASVCGAGADCGRCRRTVRAIIDARRAASARSSADPRRN
ncbi:(2Fe-2S)-binding protein [Mycolicibacterium fluoranthenivorans]|jgi:bacterioferritin-associated ferredoxin|uniref:Bacterioferritin-associated ferredoxin n=1 Tax=Mycolicibacterium fluoranthenivorans TaxID=258505 RepID=A0A1G4WPT1_9MYCO|nr:MULTISPECIES: (2Fe-2S)-binding protein [Mycobacteriaceae]MCV7251100.1 (2Fe-2S)-binding protein [Mycobacterium hackensackense]QNJ90707.1 (2Fe-2S)-binding protein [Mycolicibacterium fluoranthenivorans]SCX27109.1 bacterioferritin-associated ferredoxin [Mycolicibacterium fluoranthenivorans]